MRFFLEDALGYDPVSDQINASRVVSLMFEAAKQLTYTLTRMRMSEKHHVTSLINKKRLLMFSIEDAQPPELDKYIYEFATVIKQLCDQQGIATATHNDHSIINVDLLNHRISFIRPDGASMCHVYVLQDSIMSEAEVMPATTPKFKELFKYKWLQVNQGEHDNKISVATANDSICILPYHKVNADSILYLLRMETPAAYQSGGYSATSITGTLPANTPPKRHAVVELAEESGYRVNSSDVQSHGFVIPSKLVTTKVHLFSVSIPDANMNAKAAQGDGSEDEKQGFCSWVNISDLRKLCLCPLPELIISRLK
jgi:hypothetical protein